jgi:hypothetical protein
MCLLLLQTSQRAPDQVKSPSPPVVLQVCNGYGGAFNDRAFITYGYVPDTPRPPALYGVDRHDYELDDIWSNNMWTRELPPPFNACGCMHFRASWQQSWALRALQSITCCGFLCCA